MARYILFTSNPTGPTSDELDLIGQQATVLDKSRNALLVELDDAAAEGLAARLPGWSVQSDQVIPVPDVRKNLN